MSMVILVCHNYDVCMSMFYDVHNVYDIFGMI